MLWIQIVLFLLRGSSDGRENKTRGEREKKDAFKIIVKHVRNKVGNVLTLKKRIPRIVQVANFRGNANPGGYSTKFCTGRFYPEDPLVYHLK